MKRLLRTATLARRLLSARTAVIVDLSQSPHQPLLVEGEPVDERLVLGLFNDTKPEARLVTVEGLTALCTVCEQVGLAVFTDTNGWRPEDGETLAELAFVAFSGRKAPTNTTDSLLYQTAAQQLPNTAILMFDHDLHYVLADGPALLATVGLSRTELIGRTVGLSAAHPERLQALCRAALDGRTQSVRIEQGPRTFAVTVAPVRNGDSISHGLLFAFDDTERSKAELDVQADLVRDGLTGLLNRRGLMDGLRRRLEGAAGQGTLLFIDVDRLKQVNDRHGHAAGDEVIIAASNVLRSALRDGDLVGRLGGDEFAAFVSADATALVSRLRLAAAADPVLSKHGAGLSIGLARCAPQDDLAERLAEADREMYADKRRRRASRDSGS